MSDRTVDNIKLPADQTTDCGRAASIFSQEQSFRIRSRRMCRCKTLPTRLLSSLFHDCMHEHTVDRRSVAGLRELAEICQVDGLSGRVPTPPRRRSGSDRLTRSGSRERRPVEPTRSLPGSGRVPHRLAARRDMPTPAASHPERTERSLANRRRGGVGTQLACLYFTEATKVNN